MRSSSWTFSRFAVDLLYFCPRGMLGLLLGREGSSSGLALLFGSYFWFKFLIRRKIATPGLSPVGFWRSVSKSLWVLEALSFFFVIARGSRFFVRVWVPSLLLRLSRLSRLWVDAFFSLATNPLCFKLLDSGSLFESIRMGRGRSFARSSPVTFS